MKLNSTIRIVLAILGCLLFAGNTQATTYYVRTSGNDSNSGTSPGAAFKTIDKPCNVAAAGDTIYVGAGTYTANVTPATSGTSGSPIKCIADTTGAYTGDAGIVDLQKKWNQSGKDYWQIIGFRVSGDSSVVGINANGSLGFVIQNCTITGRLQGITVSGNSSLTISNCTISNNADDGIEINSGNAATNIAIRDCKIQGNAKNGIYFKKAIGTFTNCLITGNTQQGIWCDNDANTLPTIWNCTISDNTADGLRISGGTTVIKNCAVTYNGGYGMNKVGGTLTNAYNNVYSNTSGNYTGVAAGTGAISSDPLFADKTNGDYSISKTSPMIDVGTSAAGTVDDDLLARLRPIGSAWDLGCYEASPNGKLLLVATSTASPTTNETTRRTTIQSFGICATLIDDDDSSGNFTTAIAQNDVVYVTSDIAATSLGTKLNSVSIPLVNENVNLIDDFGFCSTAANSSGTALTISLNNHYITSTFSTGSLTIFSSSQSTITFTGTASKDIQVLGQWGTSTGLAVLEAGARRYDTGNINGRRVQLPWGGSGFSVSALNSSGQTMMKRAILWAKGLIGYWKLDETSGTTASDGSGYGRNGTANGGLSFSSNSVTSTKMTNGLNFDGYDDYIALANIPDFQPKTALSISAWIKGDSWSTGNSADVILRKGDNNPNNYQLAICDGKVSLVLDDYDAYGIRGNTTLGTGVWYHVMATWDGTTAKIYVNGVLDNGTGAARSGPIGTDTQSVYLGGRPIASNDDCFDGVLDDVRFYNYALGSDEVTNLKGLGQPRGMKVIKWVETQ